MDAVSTRFIHILAAYLFSGKRFFYFQYIAVCFTAGG